MNSPMMSVEVLESSSNYLTSGVVDESVLSSPKSRGYYLPIKYAFDRIVGCAGLFFFWPLIAILWVAVRITSPGPGFYLQRRVGMHGRIFEIVKLRTMRSDAENCGLAWSTKGDSRVTALGRILRRLHLDELPQLWNVACGHMSLVGPRPERPEIISVLEQLIPGYHERHQIKPGITGLSQVNLEPDRNINVTRQKQILDLRYIGRASLWVDAKMIAITLLRLIGVKGDAIVSIAGLKQKISHQELLAIGYQFGVPDTELWAPGKISE